MRTTEEQLDLALAAELQAALLPESCPADCGHHVAAARNRMCGGVGGDFYDFIRINPEQFAIVIGDVAGHGVRAALVMAKIMGWLRSDPQRRGRPVEVISALNDMLIDLGNRTGAVTPCSMVYLVLDTPTGIAFFINAGHPKPMLCNRRTGTVLHVGAHNMLLGVEEFQPEESCHTFCSGERLVLHTDGLADAVNSAGAMFGEKRLHEAVAACCDRDPAACAETIFARVDEFRGPIRQKDDETVVIVDRG